MTDETSGAGRPINRRDVVAGVVVIAASAGFAATAYGYGIGSVSRMDAGFFPFALGILGILLGGLVVLRAVTDPDPAGERLDFRRFLFVGGAFVVFALGIESAGLFPTIVATAMIGSLAHRDSGLIESFLLGLGLAVAIWLVFVLALGLRIPLWPQF